jgi:hypothetical protein
MRLIILSVLAAISVFSRSATPSSEDQIHSLRQEVDEVFQRHDAKRLATLASTDCHFTAPTVHTDGADALERLYTTLFTNRPDVTLTR